MIIFKGKQRIDPSLKAYVDRVIVQEYRNFDGAHQVSHAREVINNAMYLSQFYPELNPSLVYTAAGFHDLGLSGPRESHHLLSGKIIRNDLNLKKWFTDEEIEEIAMAAEDHRSSSQNPPRTLLGKIVSEADRVIDANRTLERTLRFGKDNYPGLTKEDQIKRAMLHITEKYGPSGRIKTWIPESPNRKNLEILQGLIKDRVKFYNKLSEIYDNL